MHQRVEAAIPILEEQAGPEAYREYFAALIGFHRPVEAALLRVRGIGALPIDLAARRKTPCLAADLVFLGVTHAQLHLLPDSTYVPHLETVPEALGCLDVLEGATLGGVGIYRLMARRFPGLMEHSARFLQATTGDCRCCDACSTLPSQRGCWRR